MYPLYAYVIYEQSDACASQQMNKRPHTCVAFLNLLNYSDFDSSQASLLEAAWVPTRRARSATAAASARAITIGFHALSQLGLRSGTPTLTLT